MKTKGFTMVELLGVIVVLGLLATVIYPIVNKSINRSKDELYQVQIETIEAGARSWGAENIKKLPKTEGQTVKVTLEQLQQGGYVEENLQNPKTKKSFDSSVYVNITMKNNVLEYSVRGL